MRHQLMRRAFMLIATATLTATACTTSTPTYGGHPVCDYLPSPVTCIEVDWVDAQGNGSGVLFSPEGQSVLVNFWADGTSETY